MTMESRRLRPGDTQHNKQTKALWQASDEQAAEKSESPAALEELLAAAREFIDKFDPSWVAGETRGREHTCVDAASVRKLKQAVEQVEAATDSNTVG